MAEQVVIPARFNGPPDSGHGGYSSGVAAALVEGDAAVSLRSPPPLDKPLTVERRADGEVALLDGDALVAEARPAEIDFDAPAPITVEEAEAAVLETTFLTDHPFPTCFGCGPDRAGGDGLRLFPGPVAGRSGVTGVPWTPDPNLAEDGDEVDELMLWAALDCPTGSPAANPGNYPPVVLANLAVKQVARVPIGEPHVIVAELAEVDGRKKHTHAALYSAEGELRAIARALWISLRTNGA